MTKTLKALLVLLAFAGGALTSPAVTLTPPYAVENLSVQLTATYSFQGPAKTNDHTGTITDVRGMVTINTPKFIQLLASNIGLNNLSKEATLIRVTELAYGTNFTNVITNWLTLIPNTTFLVTNIDPTNFVYQSNTNSTLFISNGLPVVPPGYSLFSTNGAETNLVQGTGDAIVVGTNEQFFINNGPGLNPANFIAIQDTNDNAGASIIMGDSARSFLNNTVALDDQNTEGHTATFDATTNFFLAQNLTNLGHIFAGSIKTNFQISGTLYNDSVSIIVGPPRGANGSVAPPQITALNGTANATAVAAGVGTGKAALPFTSWNASFPVTGSGSLGATVVSTVNSNLSYYVFESNGTYYGGPLFSAQNTSLHSNTNGPPTIAGYTNVGANYYTNYSVENPTNTTFVFTGRVTESFLKIVQAP